MAFKFLEHFKLQHEQEDFETVINAISKDVVFRGTNLWILIFAIFIASLGLNVNSTAVIIGAMLISPLMGPIMGMGLGTGINDLDLLRKSFQNYLLAAFIGLATSAIYFLISPINAAHSELLARTSPNIYDVLIALFGGFAGILAVSTKQKGNVIPGVAIATALMPPLCTAGYGIASLQWDFFFGASYLFLINTVFIALPTLFTIRLLQFPYKQLPDEKAEKRAQRVILAVIILTLVPSIYFGYDVVKQQRFLKKADVFIENEGVVANDYLLNKKIDAKNKTISLTYGGKEISTAQIANLKSKLAAYQLDGTVLDVHQGFAYLKNKAENTQVDLLNVALAEKDREVSILGATLDSIHHADETNRQVFAELKINYPQLDSAVITPSTLLSDAKKTDGNILVAILSFSKPLKTEEKRKIEEWLKVRLKEKNIKVIFD